MEEEKYIYLVYKQTTPAYREDVLYVASSIEKAEEFINCKTNQPELYYIEERVVDKEYKPVYFYYVKIFVKNGHVIDIIQVTMEEYSKYAEKSVDSVLYNFALNQVNMWFFANSISEAESIAKERIDYVLSHMDEYPLFQEKYKEKYVVVKYHYLTKELIDTI